MATRKATAASAGTLGVRSCCVKLERVRAEPRILNKFLQRNQRIASSEVTSLMVAFKLSRLKDSQLKRLRRKHYLANKANNLLVQRSTESIEDSDGDISMSKLARSLREKRKRSRELPELEVKAACLNIPAEDVEKVHRQVEDSSGGEYSTPQLDKGSHVRTKIPPGGYGYPTLDMAAPSNFKVSSTVVSGKESRVTCYSRISEPRGEGLNQSRRTTRVNGTHKDGVSTRSRSYGASRDSGGVGTGDGSRAGVKRSFEDSLETGEKSVGKSKVKDLKEVGARRKSVAKIKVVRDAAGRNKSGGSRDTGRRSIAKSKSKEGSKDAKKSPTKRKRLSVVTQRKSPPNQLVPSPPVSAGLAVPANLPTFMAGKDRLASTDDSGYPQSIASSDLTPTPSLSDHSPLQATSPLDPDAILASNDVFVDGITSMTPQGDILLTVGMENKACLPLTQVSLTQQEAVRDNVMFPELGGALSQTLLPEEAMFEPRDLVVYGTTAEGGTEVGDYEGCSVETILDSEGISDWLQMYDTSCNHLGQVDDVCNINVNDLCHSILSFDATGTVPPGADICSTFFQNDESPAVNVASVVTVESETPTPLPAEMDTGILSGVAKRKRGGRPRKNVKDLSPLSDTSETTTDSQMSPLPRESRGSSSSKVEVAERRAKLKLYGQRENAKSKYGRNLKPTWKAVSDWASTIIASKNHSHMRRKPGGVVIAEDRERDAEECVLLKEPLSSDLDALWRSSPSDDTLPVLNGVVRDIGDMCSSVLDEQDTPQKQNPVSEEGCVVLDEKGRGGLADCKRTSVEDKSGNYPSEKEGEMSDIVLAFSRSVSPNEDFKLAYREESPEEHATGTTVVFGSPNSSGGVEFLAPQVPYVVEVDPPQNSGGAEVEPDPPMSNQKEGPLLMEVKLSENTTETDISSPLTPEKIEAPQIQDLMKEISSSEKEASLKPPAPLNQAPQTQGVESFTTTEKQVPPTHEETGTTGEAQKKRVIRLKRSGGVSVLISPGKLRSSIKKKRQNSGNSQEMQVNLARVPCHSPKGPQNEEGSNIRPLSASLLPGVVRRCGEDSTESVVGADDEERNDDDMFTSRSPVPMDISSDHSSFGDNANDVRVPTSDNAQWRETEAGPSSTSDPPLLAVPTLPLGTTPTNNVTKVVRAEKPPRKKVIRVKRKLSVKSSDHETIGPANKRLRPSNNLPEACNPEPPRFRRSSTPGSRKSSPPVSRNRGSPVLRKPSPLACDEDCIDLHAADDDFFSADVEEEDPLLRIFPNAKLKGSKKAWVKRTGSTSQPSLPLKAHVSARPYAPAASYGVNELSQGVTSSNVPFHQQFPPGHLPPPPSITPPLFPGGPGVCVSGQGLMSRHGRLQAARQGALGRGGGAGGGGHESLCPPAPLFFNPPPPIPGPCPSPALTRSISQESSDCSTSPLLASNMRVCRQYMMKGACPYGPRCKYTHAHWEAVRLQTLEEGMLNFPLNLIPPEVTRRYTYDQFSTSSLQAHFPDFIQLIKHLHQRNLEGIATGHQLLSSAGVKFNAGFLCRVLEVFGEACPEHRFVKVLVNCLRTIRSRLTLDDYLLIFRTLLNCRIVDELKEMYALMKSGNLKLEFPVFSLLLRCGKDLGDWAFQLLEDIKLSDCEDGKECGVVNQFLRSVSYQVLLRPANLQRVADYLDSRPMLATRGLSLETFNRLCTAMCSCKMWSPLLSLCHRCLHMVSSPQAIVCKPLEAAVAFMGVSERTLSVIEKLLDEQKANLSNEVWNKVILTCCQRGRSQRASKFYSVTRRLGKQLSSEALFSLIDLFKKQHDLSLVVSILRDGLHRVPPLIPPLPLLTSLAPSLEVLVTAQDLHLLVTSLLNSKTNPPACILQLLLKCCSSDKCHSKLAEVVRLASDSGLVLDREFLVHVLKELRQWEGDKEDIAMVTRSLQSHDGAGAGVQDVGVVDRRRVRSGSSSSSSGSSSTSQKESTPCPSPEPMSPVMSIAEVTAPSPPTTEPRGSQYCPAEVGGAIVTVPPTPGRNLEEVMLEVPPSQDMHELLQLIKFSSKMGQFRAVSAVLVDMECTATQYTDILVLSIWEGLVNCSIRKANAFSLFVSNLDQCRASVQSKPGSQSSLGAGGSLLPSDHWLLSQLGVALLRICERNSEWQSGFVVLHNLHRYSIHYAAVFQPPSPLPLLLPHPPTPCSIALTAVNICLHLDRETSSALEVMRGCQWVGSSSETEREQRTELLSTLAQRCLDDKMLEATWECLEAITAEEVLKRLVHPVTNLHNKLLQGLLNASSMDFALSVYRSMKKGHLQCLPSVFSGLLQLLCETSQTPLAKELCQAAIADSCYAPLTKRDVFQLIFPPGLTRLELHLLLEHHLVSRVLSEVRRGNREHLAIHMSAGSRDLFELVLSENLVPRLRGAKFESKLVTIPCKVLQEWCRAVESQSADSTVKAEEEGAKGTALDPKQLLKLQKEAVCWEFGSRMRPHCKTKFESKEDYAHVLKLLSVQFVDTSELFAAACRTNRELNELGKWELSEALKQAVAQEVTDTLSRFTVYSREMGAVGGARAGTSEGGI